MGTGNSASQLEELRIDRGKPARSRWRGLWLGVAVVMAVAIALGVWTRSEFTTPATATATTQAQAQPDQTASAPSDSLLDATGYVVARREATVSSKITGKLVEVLVEEGQHVKAG